MLGWIGGRTASGDRSGIRGEALIRLIGGSKQHFSQGTRRRPRRETQVEINEQYIEAVGDIEEEEGR